MATSEMDGLRRAVAEFAACGEDKDALSEVKPRVQEAVYGVLLWVASEAADHSMLDSEIVGMGTAVKWGLLRALSFTRHHPGFLKLPQTMEMTRKNLAGIPGKKGTEIVGADLQADIAACENPQELEAVKEVMKFLSGTDRFKKDLGGVDLSSGLKNTCRASTNKAKEGIVGILRTGTVTKTYLHNSKGEVKEVSSKGLAKAMAAREAHPDAIASQNAKLVISGVDTSAQAAKLVGTAQKVPRCGLCTRPMGDETGQICSRCK